MGAWQDLVEEPAAVFGRAIVADDPNAASDVSAVAKQFKDLVDEDALAVVFETDDFEYELSVASVNEDEVRVACQDLRRDAELGDVYEKYQVAVGVLRALGISEEDLRWEVGHLEPTRLLDRAGIAVSKREEDARPKVLDVKEESVVADAVPASSEVQFTREDFSGTQYEDVVLLPSGAAIFAGPGASLFDQKISVQHLSRACDKDCTGCAICDGGLVHCLICNAAEAELPTECPGERMTLDQLAEVNAGSLDRRGGEWVWLRCPECGGEVDRDAVDNGIAMIRGPFGCCVCGWSEDEEYSHSVKYDSRGGFIPGKTNAAQETAEILLAVCF